MYILTNLTTRELMFILGATLVFSVILAVVSWALTRRKDKGY